MPAQKPSTNVIEWRTNVCRWVHQSVPTLSSDSYTVEDSCWWRKLYYQAFKGHFKGDGVFYLMNLAAVLVVFEHPHPPSPALSRPHKMSHRSLTYQQSPSTREEQREEGGQKSGPVKEKGRGH